jgi:hypothetical protein
MRDVGVHTRGAPKAYYLLGCELKVELFLQQAVGALRRVS